MTVYTHTITSGEAAAKSLSITLPAITEGQTYAVNAYITHGGVNSKTSNTITWVASAVPANTVLPALTGNPYQGVTLSSSNGTWTGTPSPTLSFQWKKGGVAIPGATSSTYTVQSSDVGSTLTCSVTAVNTGGTTTATSAATATVTKTTLTYSATTTGTFGTTYTGATPSVAGGTSNYTYSLTVAPAGPTVNSTNGVITWTSPVVGTHNFTLTVTDANGVSDSNSFTLTISSAAGTGQVAGLLLALTKAS